MRKKHVRALVETLEVNTTLETINLEKNNFDGEDKAALRAVWGRRGDCNARVLERNWKEGSIHMPIADAAWQSCTTKHASTMRKTYTGAMVLCEQ